MADLKQSVKDFNAAFERGDTEGVLAHCTDNIRWTMAGEKTVTSKAAMREWISQMEGCQPPVIRVDTLIAEGDRVVCSGDMTMKDQHGAESEYGYCDVYRFDGGKIAELTSYIVKTGPKDD